VSALAGLVELRNLDLSRNRITDVAPLAGLVNLKVLKLSDNPIRNVTALIDLSELHELDVHGIADLTCDDLAVLRRAFSERVVSADLACPASPAQARR